MSNSNNGSCYSSCRSCISSIPSEISRTSIPCVSSWSLRTCISCVSCKISRSCIPCVSGVSGRTCISCRSLWSCVSCISREIPRSGITCISSIPSIPCWSLRTCISSWSCRSSCWASVSSVPRRTWFCSCHILKRLYNYSYFTCNCFIQTCYSKSSCNCCRIICIRL